MAHLGAISRAAAPAARIVFCAVAGILLSEGSQAALLCVNTGGTDGCLASVQAAVDAAGPGDVIDIAPGTYVENIVIPAGSRLTLQGSDAATTILDGGGVAGTLRRVLLIKGPRTKVTLARLTIRNGSGGGGAAAGMFLMWYARVQLSESTVTQNQGGPAIACGDGGATLVVSGSTVGANSDNGIGLALTTGLAPGCRLTVSRSAIVNNGGHGIRATRPVKAEHSTISGNGGAGIQAVGQVAVKVEGSTIVGNAAGGVSACNHRSYVAVQSTILADNTVGGTPNDCDVGCDARFRSRGFNLFETCPALALSAPGDVLGIDPMLGPLQDNGGPTPTHALLTGSPALGEVTRSGLCRDPDQRGQPRSLPCDIGAFEAP